MKNRPLAVVATAVLAALPVHADQAVWSITGRTASVEIEKWASGLIKTKLSVAVIVPAAPSNPYTVESTCIGSLDPACVGLQASRLSDTPCAWGSLSASTRSSLVTLIGGAWCGPSGHPACTSYLGTLPWGERYFVETWSCTGGAYQSECVTLDGTIVPGLRVDHVATGAGCLL